VVVEGDTEYTAFSMIKDFFPESYSDVQIIRARGKGIIPTVASVLLQFSKGFSILHDTDSPLTATGKANPAWGMNKTIESIQSHENATGKVNLIACKTCFEVAMFGEEAKTEKPYNALLKLRENVELRNKVKTLLDALLDPDAPAPEGSIRWQSFLELEKHVAL